MVKSMTGYGRARQTLNGRDITVEVRSVNNRYLDCTVKVPRTYIFAEDAIKGRVQKAISRGKVDVFVTIDSTGADEEVVVVNEGLARSYLEALRKLYEIDGGNYLQKQSYAADLARIPDVLTVTKADPGVKGDTATNVTKPATVETGAEIKVPLFINEGDKIQIDTRTGEYLGRSKA